MGWRDSYTALLELFPQVDARIIKGAALEHGSDVGSAAEFILSEVLEPDDGNLNVEQQPNDVHRGSNNSAQGVEHGRGSAGLQCVTTTHDVTNPLTVANPFTELFMEQESERWTSDGSEYSREDVGILAPHASKDTILEGTLTERLQHCMEEDKYGALSASSSKTLLSSDVESGPRMLVSNQEQSMGKDSEGICGERSKAKESLAGVEMRVMDTSDSYRVEHELEGPSTGVSIEAVVEQYKIELEKLQDGIKLPSVNFELEDVLPNLDDQEFKVEAENLQVAPVIWDLEHGNPSILSHGLAEEGFPGVSEDGVSQCRHASESGLDDTLLQVLEQSGDRSDTEDLVGLPVVPDGDCERSDLIDLENSAMEAQLRKYFDVEDLVIDDPIVDSNNVPTSTYEDETAALGDSMDSILSVEDPFTSVNGMDGADWESLHSNSIHLTRMETLDYLVEEAKTDKEVLIISVEEIRALRLKTDQAESAARQAKGEAARGGLDVMVRVDEMRQILSRAREANAVHAGEVYGEKAVLATEARELQSRLVQVKAEKAKALSALNEIKASLQARIDTANQDREAAELEKVSREALAREGLAQEEALLAKVAQESRDLDAEAEVCTKLRDFLIDRGSIVDALQGEVAVLCEDAEALKKDLDGMSLSCSGGYVHMLSRAGSDIFNSIGSRSGKFSEIYGQPSESLAQPEGGAISSGSNSGSISLRRVPGIQKASTDKKSWSSLPSLLRALSSSQDLSSSSHSGHSSITASNSTSNSRNAVIVNPGEESHHLGSEELIEDIKYPSSQSSITSPGGALVEQEVYEAQMAMFPGEELELEYAGRHNLDIFRSQKPVEQRAEVEDEDWHLLDPATLGKHSSGSSSNSSTVK